MKYKNILIISPESWDAHFVSKHHYAITLGKKGNSVYFLNPPRTDIKDIEINETKYENVFSVDYPIIKKGLRFYPKFMRVKILKRWLEKFENKINKHIDIIWLFENSRFYDMEFAENRLKIYHQVDSNQNFHIKEAANSVDICFCVTNYILAQLKRFNEKVYKINHGLNIEFKNLGEEKVKRLNNKKINAVYVGNLDIPYLDIKLLIELVNKFSNVMFHFIGGYSKNNLLYQTLKSSENVLFWGRVESEYIHSILKNSDICLLTYKADEYKEQLANSHKLLEYLYSGKVVVATYTDEYKDKPGLIEMVKHNSEYIDRFEEVVNNLEYYNSAEKQKKRIEFALDNTYEKQLERIEKILKERG